MTPSGSNPRKIKQMKEDPAIGCDDHFDGRMSKEEQQARIDIDKCQWELDKLNDKASKESLEIEKKYENLKKLCYEKRASMIDKIPWFWVDVLNCHPQVCRLIDVKEEECLFSLKKLEVEEFENSDSGFRIKFVFDENPFFENEELVKEHHWGPKGERKSTSTTIKWKEGMNLSEKLPEMIALRKQRGLEERTFFSWFIDNENPDKDNIANVINLDIWPNPLVYYL